MEYRSDNYKECVIYLRTSTEDQNPENQLKDCESIRPIDQSIQTFCNYYLIQDKESAWDDLKIRLGFGELRNLILKKKVKYLIVWDLDRLYRNRNRLIQFFQMCKLYKVSIFCYRQRWLNDLMNLPKPFNEIMFDLMLSIMGWLAEEESNKKSDRVKSAVRKKDNITISYKGNKWGRKSLSLEDQERIIRICNQTPLRSIRNIAKDLNLSVGVVHKYIKKNRENLTRNHFLNYDVHKGTD